MAWLPEAQAPCGREDGAGEAEHRAGLARGHVGANVGQQEGADPVGADAAVADEGLAQAVRAVDGGADEASRARAGRAVHGQLGVGERVLADGHGFEHVGGVPVVPLLGRVESVAPGSAPGISPTIMVDPTLQRESSRRPELVRRGVFPSRLGGGAERGPGSAADDENAAISGSSHAER